MAAPFVIHANLDVEARWLGVALKRAVRERISYSAALLAALAPPDAAAIEIYAPEPVDPAAIRVPRVTMRAGAPPGDRADLRWADPGPIARAANDRRLALATFPLAGARPIESLAELDAHASATPGPWLCKAPWTAAGRDRAHGDPAGGPPAGELRARVARLLARAGAVVYEPLLARVADYGTCARVDAAGAVTAEPPHAIVVDDRGGFRGISPCPPGEPAPAVAAELAAAVARAGATLASRGYRGPFTIDSFTHADRATGAIAVRACCEINARYSFGVVARALGGTLGFGPPPPDALVVIASPIVTAWTTRNL
jgi:hypothetical protein|nr:hypothetical protein [Kofleriaceae bacterium]